MEQMEENDESIVISGISGVFPATKDMQQLEHNLRNKRNLISSEENSSFNIGKIPNIEKFDAAYFGMKPEQADIMDPMGRLLLEKTYEAIIDSGYNPECLRGEKVGVFVGIYLSETEAAYYTSGSMDDMAITGISRCFLANRISYCFGIHGPSLCVDTACSSSMYALHLARLAIRNGDCDSAIVGGCNLCLNNGITLHLQRLGVVSQEGAAKVLDESGNGYCRAETVCSMLLQKRKHARRIYATLVHTKLNSDGYKAEGITFPSCVMQKQLLTEFYQECNVKPSAIEWLELHATGTRAGDREEIKAAKVFCQDRHAALKVGTIRSNMGHAEAASTMCSIAKVIIAMRSGVIPPNINYSTPRNDIDALHNGLVQVITENTPWQGGLVGINSLGLGGSNGHALLKSFDKTRITNVADTSAMADHLPRLVTVSGRTAEAVDVMLSELEKNLIDDDEYVSLLHDIHGEDIVRHLYRGAIIRAKNSSQVVLFKEIAYYPSRKPPVWFVFAGMGCQWPAMAKSLMKLPVFSDSVTQCHRILQAKNIDLIRVLRDDNVQLLENVINCFVAITAIQIALVDVLRSLNITPAGVIGHSAGEIACAYADGCLNKEQTILCAYYRGLSCMEKETDLVVGAMAAVGLPYEELKNRIPHEVDIACWNSARNCTISGPKQKVDEAIDILQAQKIFVRRVNSSNIAFHSRYVKQVRPILLRYLREVIPNPRLRSEKWISTSVSRNDRHNTDAKYCSAEYLANNLENTVLFEEAAKHIPEDAIVVELSPHSLLRAILQQTRGVNAATYVPLGIKQCPDSLEYLLKSVAKLFLIGVTPTLRNLYPTVEYPVSKETPMIAPLVRWQHDRNWDVVFSKKEDTIPGERRYTFFGKTKEHAYMFDHVIDGRSIVPGTAYLLPIWETIPLMYNKKSQDTSIVFENLRFNKIITMHRDRNINALVHIQKGSGNFEIVEGNELVLSGRVRILHDDDDIDKQWSQYDPPQDDDEEEDDDDDDDHHHHTVSNMQLNQEDIYKEFRLRGFQYKNLFRQLLSSNFSGTRARVKWNDNWVTFLDTLTQTHILKTDTRLPCLLTGIDKLVINVKAHKNILRNLQYQQKGIPLHVDENLNLVMAGGVQIRGIKGRIIPRRKLKTEPSLLIYKFTPYIGDTRGEMETDELFCFYARLLWQNIFTNNVKILEYAQTHLDDGYHYSTVICRALNDYPHTKANTVIVSTTAPSSDDHSQTNQFVKFIDERQQVDVNVKVHLLVTDSTDNLQDKLIRLMDEGFLMIRTKTTTEIPQLDSFALCSQHIYKGEKLIVFRRNGPVSTTPHCVRITQTFEWLETLKEELKRDDDKEIVVYAERDVYNGAMGFYNCLRKEIPSKRIRCILILDEDAAQFSPHHSFYKEQLSKNLSVNVYKDKSWGCYVHLAMPTPAPVRTCYAFANVGVTGDLRSLSWYQGNVLNSLPNAHQTNVTNDVKFIHVYFAALNFKDVLLASGMLTYEMFVPSRIMQDCLIGCEFSGRDNNGKRYMGMYPAGAISTVLLASTSFLWEIPNSWSLEESATVPVVYLTVIAAFFVHGNLKKGESVLIHSGAGGVGQAAINIATYYGCEIFTTVGTAEKKEFIKKTFPHIEDSHVGNSRDTSFEKLVMTVTKGRGVDLVLNSLAEDKLQASVRCLAKGGRFLEIGKLDLLKDNALGMNIFLRGISFHCVLLDKIYEEKDDVKNAILERFRRELKCGSIKPIVRTVFNADDVESAFRYMATGKHIGKVLIKLRDEESERLAIPTLLQKNATPRFNCDRQKVYIICGGLGGMGLELADWLVLRGARKLILTSRVGVADGYQKFRINLWKSYGATITIRTDDLTKVNQVEHLLRYAKNLGTVCAIFNLAAVIDDKMFENQDVSTFEATAAPKREATRLLDQVSRKLCPNLEQFVVFSTLSCGYGNPAQTNYGFASSCCERICEVRKEHGFPALAIQWGVVGDVGILTRMDIEKTSQLVGLKQQPIRSCLSVMDKLLNQSEPIVSSYILDDKITSNDNERGNLTETVANILGVKDMKSISIYSPLPEFGMDSITGLEIKQILEQQYDIFLSAKELISLTFAELESIEKTGKKSAINVKNDNSVMASIPSLRNILLNKAKKINLLNAELVIKLPTTATLMTESNQLAAAKNIVFCFPAIDGIAASLEPLSKNSSLDMQCFQYIAVQQADSAIKQAEIFSSYILETIPSTEEYNILAYSYGVIIAIETIKILHSKQRKGKCMLIDGSIEFAKTLRSIYFGGINDLNDIQIKVITDVITSFQPTMNTSAFENDLKQLKNWDTRLDYMMSKFSTDSNERENVKFITDYLYQTYKSMNEYDFAIQEKLDTRVAVIRAKKLVIPIPTDTGLHKYFSTVPEEFHVDENHFTILQNRKVAEIVDGFFKT